MSILYLISTIIDFRNKNKRTKRPDKKKIDYLIELEEKGKLVLDTDGLKKGMINFVRDIHSQKLFRKVLDLCIARPDAVVLEHCRGGKDRTGYASALILLALGVDTETVVDDYLLTGKFNCDRNAKRMAEYRQYTDNQHILAYLSSAMQTREDVIRAGIKEMVNLAGNPINYIKEVLGFDSHKVEKMRSMYLN